ncbi:MAG: hypothetical protein KA586_09995 [Candidatus Promineofilum sp.]|nr:hypothetical protein [Promineifilum sp.]
MAYFTIHHTTDGRPYIIEKNYGYKLEREGSSSHWTWHITRDGVEYLARNNVIRPGQLPTYINDDELEDLKAYKMLTRVNGERIGNQGLYPSDDPAWQRRMAEQESSAGGQNNPTYRKKKPPQTKTAAEKPVVIRIGPEYGTSSKPSSKKAAAEKGSDQTRPARQSKPKVVKIEPDPEEQPAGFWASLRSIFGKR